MKVAFDKVLGSIQRAFSSAMGINTVAFQQLNCNDLPHRTIVY